MDSELVLGASHLLKPVGNRRVYVYTFDLRWSSKIKESDQRTYPERVDSFMRTISLLKSLKYMELEV
jgi:hypothetical protein